MATFLLPSEYTIGLSGELFQINVGGTNIVASNTTTKFSLSPGKYTFNLPYGAPLTAPDDFGDLYPQWNVDKTNADFTIPVVFFVQDGGYNISGGVVDISCSDVGGVNLVEDYPNNPYYTNNALSLFSTDYTTDNSNILITSRGNNMNGTYVDTSSNGTWDTYLTPSGERPYFYNNYGYYPVIYDGSATYSSQFNRLKPVSPDNAWDSSENVISGLVDDYGLNFTMMPDISGNTDVFGKKVVVTIDACFNPISLYDYSWGWTRGGIRMFQYATPISSEDASNIAITTTGVADLSAGDPFTIIASDADFNTLKIGSTTNIINNRSAFFVSAINQVKTDLVDVSYSQIVVSISGENIPLTQTERDALYTTGLETFRIIQGVSGESFALDELSTTEGVFINMPATANAQSFSISVGSNSFTATIKALGGGDTQADALYNVAGADSGNGTDLPVGSIVAFKGYTIVLGDFVGTLDEEGGGGGVIPCFKRGTKILTPDGYKAVELLKAGDQVTTRAGSTEIVEMLAYIGKSEETPLYRLKKDSLDYGVPTNDLYMSNTHAFKNKGIWQHMGCAQITELVEEDNIPYYHIVTSDYFSHTLRAEGVEVETCFRDKGNGVLMMWSCNEKCCRPLKCKFATAAEIKAARIEKETKNLFMTREKNKVIENKILWAYNSDKQMNMPMVCTQVDL